MISDQQKLNAKEKALTELKGLIAITLYLWVLFSLFEIHRFAVLREVHLTSISGYRLGFAAVNAFVLAKVILLGETLRVGEQFREKRLIHSVLFKSAIFALLLMSFHIVEEVIVGVIHGKSISASVPQMAGGGLEGKILYGVMAFVLLIPFFLFTEVQRVLGKEKMHWLILEKRSKADAA
jgi:hypothetical protein